MGLSICHWLETYAFPLGLPQQGPGHFANASNTPKPPSLQNLPTQSISAQSRASEQVTLLRGIAARIAQEMALSQCHIFDVSVLAEVLELPFAQAWGMLQPLSLVTSQLLRQLSRRRPLRRNEGTWLSFQIAYLRALDELLHQEAHLFRPWLDAAKIPLTAAQTLSPQEALENASLGSLIENLRAQRLTDAQAEQALVSGAQSPLVKQIRQVMVVWLMFNGAEEREAELLIQRLEHGLAGHLLATIAENATPLAQLQKFVRLGHLGSWNSPEDPEQDYEIVEERSSALPTIEPQRELYRAQLLQQLSEPLLGQVFGLQDLYVPLMGEPRPLIPQLRPREPATAEDALTWAISQLSQPQTIPIIEAGAGQGKSCFSHQFAVRLAQDLYPTWMPVVISLRGLPLGATLEETLAPALPRGLFMERESWLSAQNPPCVLILDGLDELPLGPDGEGQISQFLAQLQAFQRRYRSDSSLFELELGAASSRGPRHRILLTSQPATFETLLKAHPELNLEQQYRRLRLLPMDQLRLKSWFRNWAQLQNKAIAQSYFNFLKNGGAFRSKPRADQTAVAALAHWPFTLLLMALLHRDGFLDDRIFELSAESLQFEIYERLNTWLLGAATDAYPQPGMMADRSRSGPSHACRSPDVVANFLAGRSPRDVRQHIQTVAFRVLQSGRGQLITHTDHAPAELPLPSLYFRAQSLDRDRNESGLEKQRLTFSSPSLGDYNCAEAMADALQRVTQRVQTGYGEMFVLETPEALAQHLYQLLGHAPLSPRLVSFVLERLRREQQRESPGVSFEVLSDRLYEFYRYYCQGRWLDEGLPQAAYKTFRALDNPFSMLQVDAAVGLNVFTLLCAFARETDRPFWPCGNPTTLAYNPNRLLQLMGRTAILSPLAFWVYARRQLGRLHLSKARLNQVMLVGADLRGVACREASLMGSNLEGSDLTGADLTGSNLQRVNLRHSLLIHANFQGADLRYADLTGAHLEHVNLTNACVAHAHMDASVSAIAQRSGAFFSVTEYQAYQSLVRAEMKEFSEGEETLEHGRQGSDRPKLQSESPAHGGGHSPRPVPPMSSTQSGSTFGVSDTLNASASASSASASNTLEGPDLVGETIGGDELSNEPEAVTAAYDFSEQVDVENFAGSHRARSPQLEPEPLNYDETQALGEPLSQELAEPELGGTQRLKSVDATDETIAL